MKARLALMFSLIVVALAAIPAVSSATSIAGPPGKIAFTSGRPSVGVPAPNTGDAGARIYVTDYPSGTPVQVTTKPEGAAIRHRQPNWSPDHTRIAYAGGSGTSYALWILDLRTGSQTEIVPATTGLDRPSWSPDGTEIAYGAEGDLWVKGVEPATTPVRVTDNAGTTEERPVWSPDGNTLYYNRGVPPFNTGSKRDLYKISPVDAGSTEEEITSGEDDDWQPSLSPDGKTLCFLRGPMSDKATIQLVSVNGGLVTPFSTTTGGNINCVWSPEGSEILYTQGVFGAGDLALRNTSGIVQTVPSSWKIAEHFDGNADWATNFSPKCDSKNVTTGVNQFTTIKLGCVDPDHGFGAEAPQPDPIGDDGMEIASQPQHGTIGSINENETVIYTPNKDFTGNDSFTYIASDGTSEGDPAKISITVTKPGGGGSPDKTAPKISAVKVSAKRWLLGSKLATFSKSPVGTTISFKLSEAARATLTFQRQKVKKGKKTFVTAGKLSFAAKNGKNKVKFQGLLKKSKSLAPGAYRAVIGAKDSAGNSAKAKNSPIFTILAP